MASTVLDLARFDRALHREELISPSSRAAMLAPARSEARASLPYGLGWFVEQYEGRELRWHSGWWDDACSALYLKRPDEGRTLLLLANSEGIWWENPRDSADVRSSHFARAFLRAFP